MVLPIFVLGLSLTLFKSTDSYMVIQVRRQDANHSNVNAIIHKIVPTYKLEKFASTMSRKSAILTEEKESKNITTEKKNKAVVNSKDVSITKEVEQKMSTPAPQLSEKEPVFADLLKTVAKQIARGKSGPMFRSKSEGYLFKPEKVILRNGESPSVYNIESDSLVTALKDILSSVTVQRYLDKLTRKAATVYRAVESEAMQDPAISSFINVLNYFYY